MSFLDRFVRGWSERKRKIAAHDKSVGVSANGFAQCHVVAPKQDRAREQEHTAHFQFKASGGEKRLLDELVREFKDEGYRTESDLLRHAMRDHIDRLLRLRPLARERAIKSVYSRVLAEREALERESYVTSWDDMLDAADEHIQRCERIDAREEASATVRSLLARAESIESTVWREHYRKEVLTRFSHYCDEIKQERERKREQKSASASDPAHARARARRRGMRRVR